MSEFIKVTKGGDVIEIHPDALVDHKRLGWVEVEPAVAVETAVEKKPEATPEKKPKGK